MSDLNDYTSTPVKSNELVTDSLVKSALVKDKGKEAELLSFEVKPFTQTGDNFLSVVSEVLVRYRLNGSEFDVSYVAKLNPLQPVSSFNEVLEEMFGRETDIFSTIVGGMNEQLEMLELPPLKTPKLFSRILEKRKEAFLTENLRVQGFKMFDRRKGMDLNHCTLALKELGRFHASSLLYEETLHPKTIPESFDYFKYNHFDASHDFNKYFVTLMISQAESVCNFLKKAGPKYEKCEKWLIEHRHKISKNIVDGFTPNKPFDILVHGDWRTSNMLFRYNEDNMPIDFRFVDLQCSKKASPATDLNYFFFTSLDGEFRMTKRDIMTKIYYDSFREVLEKSGRALPFSFQELEEELKKRSLFGLCSAIMILPLIFAEGDEIWYNDNYNEDELDEFLDINRQKCEKLSEKDSIQQRILEVFDEMIESNVFD
ncbi:UNVERIFIED_CONTAM: hypothetical protein RMT77_000161 [Armadillidium vulgare]